MITVSKKLNHKSNSKRIIHELKGSSTSLEIKKYFYNHIVHLQGWSVATIVVDKLNLLLNPNDHINQEALYVMLTAILLDELNLNCIDQIILIADNRKHRQDMQNFNIKIANVLKAKLTIKTTVNVTHELSQSNKGIQAIDMFCHGIFRKYEFNDKTWYSLFEDRVANEIVYNRTKIKKTVPAT